MFFITQDYVNNNYKLLNISYNDLSSFCFDGVPIQENWWKQSEIKNSIRFFSVLSPILTRDFFSHLIYSLSHFSAFFSSSPTQFYLFVPVSKYREIISRPSNNLSIYTSLTILINSLFDCSEINLYSSKLKNVERVKIENKFHTVIPSSYFSYTDGHNFRSKENFIFLNIKPKLTLTKFESEFIINYVYVETFFL